MIRSQLLVLALLFLPVLARAEWQTSKENGIRSLSYSATAPVLGKPTYFTVTFHSDTTETKVEHGVIGFDLTVKDVGRLAPFSFGDFEGPDATTGGKKLLTVNVARKGQPALTFAFSPSGSTPVEGSFTFEAIEVTSVPASEPKTLLKALRDGSESLEIAITDPRNAKLALHFVVPVAGQEARFRELLTGVK